MTKYLLDTNIYINFYDRYYLFEFFPSFWDELKRIINLFVVIPDIVLNEHYQSIWFENWLKDNFTGAYCKHSAYADEWAEVIRHIANHAYYSERALTNDKSWAKERIADGWLVAIAKKDHLVIVSDEKKNINLNATQPSQHPKIPDIADDFEIRCIDMNTFFQEIGLKV